MYSKYCVLDNETKEFSEPFELFKAKTVNFKGRELAIFEVFGNQRYTPVAYTGFKFSKTEWKEGDIVESLSGMYKGEIIYMPDWGKWVVKFRNSYSDLDDITTNIIGNKFQHPELLKIEQFS